FAILTGNLILFLAIKFSAKASAGGEQPSERTALPLLTHTHTHTHTHRHTHTHTHTHTYTHIGDFSTLISPCTSLIRTTRFLFPRLSCLWNFNHHAIFPPMTVKQEWRVPFTLHSEIRLSGWLRHVKDSSTRVLRSRFCVVLIHSC